jgi:hypothetical protein
MIPRPNRCKLNLKLSLYTLMASRSRLVTMIEWAQCDVNIASPYHPQTNNKIERYHRTIKGEINQVPYEMPSELKEAIKAFIDYNYQRYHEGLGDITPYDVYTNRHLEVIRRRKKVKSRTLQARRNYNRAVRKQDCGL